MTRIKRGIATRAKHKRLLKAVKGYRGTKSKLIKVAHEAFLHAGQYAYHGRKLRKRDSRKAWILRIGEAAKVNGLTYSKLIYGLKQTHIELDRKILSELIINDPQTFSEIINKVKSSNFTSSK